MAEHTVYAVASGKGGVGKTATTVNLGAALAEQGYSVAIVDADLGMANLGGFLGVAGDGPTLHEVLAGGADLEDAVYEVDDGLAVVPSGISLEGFADVETASLSDAVGTLRDAFDYVLLDLGAGLSHDTVLPLALADAVVLVSTPKPLALQDTRKTREITERLGGAVAGVVLTRAHDLAGLDPDEVAEEIGIPVLAVVPEDPAVHESAEDARPVVGHVESPAAESYRGLAEIVVEESLENAPVVPESPVPARGVAHGAVDAAGDEGSDAATDEGSDAAGEDDSDPTTEDPTTEVEAPDAGGEPAASDEDSDAADDPSQEVDAAEELAAAAEEQAAVDSPSEGPALSFGGELDEEDAPSGEADGAEAAADEGGDDAGTTEDEAGGDEAAGDDEDAGDEDGEETETFSVQGAEPDVEDEDDEESGGLLSRFFG